MPSATRSRAEPPHVRAGPQGNIRYEDIREAKPSTKGVCLHPRPNLTGNLVDIVDGWEFRLTDGTSWRWIPRPREAWTSTWEAMGRCVVLTGPQSLWGPHRGTGGDLRAGRGVRPLAVGEVSSDIF